MFPPAPAGGEGYDNAGQSTVGGFGGGIALSGGNPFAQQTTMSAQGDMYMVQKGDTYERIAHKLWAEELTRVRLSKRTSLLLAMVVIPAVGSSWWACTCRTRSAALWPSCPGGLLAMVLAEVLSAQGEPTPVSDPRLVG